MADDQPTIDDMHDAISGYTTHAQRMTVASEKMGNAIQAITKAVMPYIAPAQSEAIHDATREFGLAQVNLGEAMILLGVDMEKVLVISEAVVRSVDPSEPD